MCVQVSSSNSAALILGDLSQQDIVGGGDVLEGTVNQAGSSVFPNCWELPVHADSKNQADFAGFYYSFDCVEGTAFLPAPGADLYLWPSAIFVQLLFLIPALGFRVAWKHRKAIIEEEDALLGSKWTTLFCQVFWWVPEDVANVSTLILSTIAQKKF